MGTNFSEQLAKIGLERGGRGAEKKKYNFRRQSASVSPIVWAADMAGHKIYTSSLQ